MGECWRSLDLSLAGSAGIFLTIAAMVLYCVSVGEVSWVHGDGDTKDVDMGLFKFCQSRCERYVDGTFLGQPTNLALVARTRACSSMVVMAILCCLATCIMCAFSIGRKGHFVTIRRASFSQFLAGLLGLIAVAIFGDIINQLNDDERFSVYTFEAKGALVSAAIAMFVNLFAGAALYIDSGNVVYMSVDGVSTGGGGMV
eukprot:m.336649 g.336649  ORF g.336649 m.336649 type:complete len:200 (+) comp17913_c0_seq1:121-720(+)